MKWNESYATGNKEVDEQHKMLFLTSDRFRETLEYGFGEKTYDLFLQFLSAYAEQHFAFEEECMFIHSCPSAKQNKEEHCLFLKVIQKEVAIFEKIGFEKQRAFALLDKVDKWLGSHIARIDVQLKTVLT
ncbi:bacteriohemerythrin [mine drainage metagenome]|uniref:Bacteriohemerythrin n=1 Tax=mine drainage metagenome TaxID=410659 RepID=A0A1J5PUZ5_9ZZZZ